MKTVLIYIVLLSTLCSQSLFPQVSQKNRAIILTDIEADPDDTQSLVRLLLYSNVIDIKGLVATTSCWHQTSVDPEFIEKEFMPMAKYTQTLQNIRMVSPVKKRSYP